MWFDQKLPWTTCCPNLPISLNLQALSLRRLRVLDGFRCHVIQGPFRPALLVMVLGFRTIRNLMCDGSRHSHINHELRIPSKSKQSRLSRFGCQNWAWVKAMSKTDDYIQNISKPDQDLLPWLHWYTHHDSGATGCKPCPTATSTHGLGSLFLGDCGCKQGQNGGETCVIKFSYGSRPKTHARLLVSEWHLQIWMCMFCCSGERPRKGGVRFAKGLNTNI